jgi:uncharacterized protein YggE
MTFYAILLYIASGMIFLNNLPINLQHMKFLQAFCITLFFCSSSLAQSFEKTLNTIDVQGYAKLPANPENYIAQFLIQEEEQKVGYTTIGKLPIDSVKINLFSNLKKFGIEEKELKILGTSSQALGQYPNFLINVAYEIKLKNKEAATKLLNEMRFNGLKGLVIKRIFTKAQKDALADSLYDEAIKDAKKIAIELAKKANKTIGEIRSIELRSNSLTSFGMDMEANTDNFASYNYNKFEMDHRDKYATCYVKVIFEMK